MKEKVINILINIAPVVALLLYFISGFALYVDASKYNETFLSNDTNVSLYEILYVNHGLLSAKIIVIISLCFLFVSIVGVILSYILKEKKPFLLKASMIVLLISILILLFTYINRFTPVSIGTITNYYYFNFMTIWYLILVAYVSIMIYLSFKIKKD